MNDHLRQLMRDATRLTRAGRLDEATTVIQLALRGTSAPATSAPATVQSVQCAEQLKPGKFGSVTLDAIATTPGGNVYDVDATDYNAANADVVTAESACCDGPQGSTAVLRPAEAAATAHIAGRYSSGSHTHLSRTIHYKRYAPTGHAERQLPLVVMLHGCGQHPDDFAAGTRMNAAAREQGFFVLYPAQSPTANASRCWNWFQPADQARGRGEPALIASLALAVVKQYNLDARRIYIAGLSAGGAMATIVAAAYPEIFAAVGVHSGLARGAASNVLEALSVMQSGDPNWERAGSGMHVSAPTIVFHGDQDQTVHPRNGEQAVAAVRGRKGDAETVRGVSARGRHFTRSIHADETGKPIAEHWLLHGAGHAWSGGDAAGSYTDASGPDATREMLRFFFTHQCP